MDQNKVTHVLTLQIGFDLGKLLDPENIQGVMAYLGVENESNLINTIAYDKYDKVLNALYRTFGNEGISILSNNFEEAALANNHEVISKSPTELMKMAQENTSEKEIQSVKNDVETEKDNSEETHVMPPIEADYDDQGEVEDLEFKLPKLAKKKITQIIKDELKKKVQEILSNEDNELPTIFINEGYKELLPTIPTICKYIGVNKDNTNIEFTMEEPELVATLVLISDGRQGFDYVTTSVFKEDKS